MPRGRTWYYRMPPGRGGSARQLRPPGSHRLRCGAGWRVRWGLWERLPAPRQRACGRQRRFAGVERGRRGRWRLPPPRGLGARSGSSSASARQCTAPRGPLRWRRGPPSSPGPAARRDRGQRPPRRGSLNPGSRWVAAGGRGPPSTPHTRARRRCAMLQRPQPRRVRGSPARRQHARWRQLARSAGPGRCGAGRCRGAGPATRECGVQHAVPERRPRRRNRPGSWGRRPPVRSPLAASTPAQGGFLMSGACLRCSGSATAARSARKEPVDVKAAGGGRWVVRGCRRRGGGRGCGELAGGGGGRPTTLLHAFARRRWRGRRVRGRQRGASGPWG
jgi:hypothetical protein